jgi:acylphosphatase
VHGRVQRVGFRVFVQRRARELGLRGYARNLDDEISVEVVAEGPRSNLEALLAALHLGPPGSDVETVDVIWTTASSAYEGFATY